MMEQRITSVVLPDRPPTLTEAVFCLLVVTMVALGGTSHLVVASWSAAFIGFVLFLIIQILHETGIGQQSRHVRFVGWATATLALFTVAIGVFLTERPLGALINDIAVGGLLAYATLLIVHILSFGEVSGWWPNTE